MELSIDKLISLQKRDVVLTELGHLSDMHMLGIGPSIV